LVNYGWIDYCSRSLNRSRIHKYEKLSDPDADSDFKNFGTGAESEYEKMIPATSDIYGMNKQQQSDLVGRSLLLLAATV